MNRKILYNTVLSLVAILLATGMSGCTKDDDITQDGLSQLIVSSLQTVIFVSDHSDKAITLMDDQSATLRYQVMPADAAQQIAASYASQLRLDVILPLSDTTLPAVTRPVTTPALTISDVSATADGLLTLTVTHSGFVRGQDYATALALVGSQLTFQTAYSATRLIEALSINDEEISQTMAE